MIFEFPRSQTAGRESEEVIVVDRICEGVMTCNFDLCNLLYLDLA